MRYMNIYEEFDKLRYHHEHEAAKWLAKDELDSVRWLPADVIVVDKIRCMYESATANGFTSFAEA